MDTFNITMLQPFYHIYNKSIEHYIIFRETKDYQRFISSLGYYKYGTQAERFSRYLELLALGKNPTIEKSTQLVNIFAYCIMPTHYHIMIEECEKGGLEKFISLVQNSYSHYFNRKYSRKGPLWQNRYKKKLFVSENYFLMTTQYIHINPVKAGLVEKPEQWPFSSYINYTSAQNNEILDNFKQYIPFSEKEYSSIIESSLYKLAS